MGYDLDVKDISKIDETILDFVDTGSKLYDASEAFVKSFDINGMKAEVHIRITTDEDEFLDEE